MNLRPLMIWGFKTLAIVDHPGPEVLKYGTKERLEEKLGWLRRFREALKDWSELEQVIGVGVDFVRTQGMYRGAARGLRKRLAKLSLGPSGTDWEKTCRGLSRVRRLRPGERLPACSEVIETCFGKFKTLEREQARGGLRLALGAGRMHRRAHSRGRSRGTPESQNPRGNRLDQNQAGPDRGLQAPPGLSVCCCIEEGYERIKKRNKTGGNSFADFSLIFIAQGLPRGVTRPTMGWRAIDASRMRKICY